MYGQLREVGDRCSVLVRPGGWGEANHLLIVGDGASTLVDTPWDRRVSRHLADLIRPLTAQAPVSQVVNTHADGDHWWGNVHVPRSAAIVTSQGAMAQMRSEPGPRQVALLTAASSAVATLPSAVSGAAQYLCCIVDGVKMPRSTRLPDHTFSGQLDLVVGGRSIDLRDEGPAHSAGDVVVTVKDAGVVAMGDLMFQGSTPILWHGPLQNWLTALDRIIDLAPEVVVPGHGPLCGADDVAVLRDYWLWVEAEAQPHFEADRSPVETGRRLLASMGGEPWATWQHPDRIGITLHTLWRLWQGEEPRLPTTLERAAALATANALRFPSP